MKDKRKSDATVVKDQGARLSRCCDRKRKQCVSGLVKVGTLQVDVSSLSQLAHCCRPDCCGDASCCSYEVHVTAREMSRIIGLLPAASEFCPHLKLRRGFDNIFEDLGAGVYALETDDAGRCLLAYKHGRSFRCSLHTVALQSGVSPHKVKPFECSLWPLALTSSRAKILTVDDNAYDYPCSARQPVGSPLCPSVREAVESLFGSDMLRSILLTTAAEADSYQMA